MGDLNQTVTLEVRGHLARRRLKRNDMANILKVSLRTVSDLLGERRPWRVDEIETVAAWLDISVSDLLFPKHAGYSGRRPQAQRRAAIGEDPFEFETSVLRFEPLQEPSPGSARAERAEHEASVLPGAPKTSEANGRNSAKAPENERSRG
ncbi:hypothetical protein Srot_1208 [Segniliparus rotundus DSM 44985]|uniref:Uncharacterized protein n=1 Tax=Segniliparus rotundus (strain ATCC BAA-972 / CDC 1076 / CIP 108378 / DSM 44985 / JCM 13578) TaxID=640132 RepID=D6ZFF5_SEGRD|nr:helix-turn-helix transcriptional regulator [Segniliparus rotundus]ADG97679.1 hypothetical protein Srot_1208 [Segniliparus rotundus DSM 44985]